MVSVMSPGGGVGLSGVPINDQALQLLDFSQKLDITLLDTVVAFFYTAVGEEVSQLMLNWYTVKLL